MSKGTKAVSIFGGLALVVTLAACGSSDDSGSARVDIPKSLVGTWYQTNKLDSGVVMQAEVHRGGTVQVNMKTRDSSSIYWMGSFPSHRSPAAGFKTTSKADPDAQKVLAGSIFGSQDTSKRFKYKRGDLSFKFTMMGTTTTIHMRKPYKTETTKATKKPSVSTGKKVPSTATPTRTRTPAPAAKAPSVTKKK
ncbi:hypothetical protein SEA_KARDASHIAN_44 [Streptomyces phage Kardashian]|nr:hypothetical protein SEA_KARDASHIAN_44 [Streptomyces phage Kardashian]